VALESIFRFAGFGTEIVLIALILTKRLYRTFPVFSAYLIWDLLDNLILYFISFGNPSVYFYAFLVALAVDSVFVFAVLVELAWSVLRPFRSALPRSAIVVVAFVVGLVAAAVWPFAHSAAYLHYGPQSRLLIHTEQTVSIMRVLFFLVLAGCSQLLSISWRDREMQIATGLGLYSLVSIAISIMEAGATGTIHYRLDQITLASYMCSLLYWVFSFSKQAAPRREFTPQMQGFLLAMAGTARNTRISLTDAQSHNPRTKDDR
jgi:hypothetical protein